MPITPIGNDLPTSICPFCKITAQHLKKKLYYTCEHEDPPLEEHYELYDGVVVHVCTHCEEETIWFQEEIIYPQFGNDIALPHADLPSDTKDDYLEAAGIVDISPRGACALLRLCVQKLCNHVLDKSQKIDKAIGELVRRKLISEQTQQRLDIVRVIGNDAVHPGSMDLKDDKETARSLFVLVNECAESMITRPVAVEKQYSNLPPEKLRGIADRDKVNR